MWCIRFKEVCHFSPVENKSNAGSNTKHNQNGSIKVSISLCFIINLKNQWHYWAKFSSWSRIKYKFWPVMRELNNKTYCFWKQQTFFSLFWWSWGLQRRLEEKLRVAGSKILVEWRISLSVLSLEKTLYSLSCI